MRLVNDEKCVENLKEVNISVLGDEESQTISVTEEVKNNGGLLTFEKKYLSTNGKNSSESLKIKNTQKNEDLQKNTQKNTKNDENSSKNSKNEIKYKKNEVKNCDTKSSSLLSKKLGGTKNGMQNLDRIIPANITEKQKNQIEELAKKIFVVTNSKGVVRIDFMIDSKSGKVFANEINSIPGSFAFYLWQDSGTTFDKLLERLIEIAQKSKQKKEKLLSTFDSNVIKK